MRGPAKVAEGDDGGRADSLERNQDRKRQSSVPGCVLDGGKSYFMLVAAREVCATHLCHRNGPAHLKFFSVSFFLFFFFFYFICIFQFIYLFIFYLYMILKNIYF